MKTVRLFYFFLVGSVFLLGARSSAWAQDYTVPQNHAPDSEIQQIIDDASKLISEGSYDGVESAGTPCTVGVELQNGPITNECLKNGFCGYFRIAPYLPVTVGFPYIEGEGAGPIYIPDYSFQAPVGTLDGQMDLVIAQSNGSSTVNLVEYKITGKNGIPSEVAGAFGFGRLPIKNQIITIMSQYPKCLKLIKRAP